MLSAFLPSLVFSLQSSSSLHFLRCNPYILTHYFSGHTGDPYTSLSKIDSFGSTRSNLDNSFGLGGVGKGSTKEQSKQHGGCDIKIWGWSLLSFLPWVIKAKDKTQAPNTINKGLKMRVQFYRTYENDGAASGNPLRFRPYVSKVPWHTGPRGFLSQLFPRYGHYCGPNWSSGKDGGSFLWYKRPIDWLDYCCYCHDIGYGTHDQASLLKADLKFLECLERPHMATKGDSHIAHIYKTMCITGLRNILIPYRTHIVKLQFGERFLKFGWLSNVKWRAGTSRNDEPDQKT